MLQEDGDAIGAVRKLRKSLLVTSVSCLFIIYCLLIINYYCCFVFLLLYYYCLFYLYICLELFHSCPQLHPSSSVIENYDCKYGGVSEEEGLPFVTEFEYMLDELVEIIWNWVVT